MALSWLITGGCGFIGTSLIRRLVKEGGHHIRVIDNLSVGSRDDLKRVCAYSEISPESFDKQSRKCWNDKISPLSHIELVVGDILDDKLALSVTWGADVIVHLAANTGVVPSVENPRQDCLLNVLGTLNYLEAARHNQVSRFIFASSGAPVGEAEPPIHEELAPHPVSPYGASKLAGEGYCSAYYRSYGVKTVDLRFGNVYGPGSGHKTSVIAKFVRQAFHGKPLEIYGDGTQTRDFIYIDDLIRAILLAVNPISLNISANSHSPLTFGSVVPGNEFQACRVPWGEIFQVATATETTILEVIEILVPILKDAGIEDIKVIQGNHRLGDVHRNCSDTSKILKYLGWQTQIDLEQGLSQTVKWFKDELA
jgi:UDP-glucose 4-epimerase